MDRPKDIYGKPIEMGPWYWAKSRTGKIVGVGKFAATICRNDILFYIHEAGYEPDNYTFVKAEEPDFAFGITCEHGIKDGDWCSKCRKAVEDARNYELQVGSHGEPMPYGGD